MLQVNDDPVMEASGKVPVLGGAAELFIGCRSHRSGLAKTLGSARISDVIYWPDRMILGSDGDDVALDLKLLRDFWRWNR